MKLSDDDLEMARGIYEMRIWCAFIFGGLAVIASIVLFIMAPFMKGDLSGYYVGFGTILLVGGGIGFGFGFYYIVWPHIEKRRNEKREQLKKAKEKEEDEY